jgi:nickel-dependent lactate racemase
MARSDRLYDVVVTTNSGYPLDQNLYQTVKGMSAAAQIVKRGGAIVVVSECSDGMPDHGGYRHLLAKSSTPEDFLRMIEQQGFVTHDQWQVQIQAMIRLRARVFVKNEVVADAVLRQSWLDPVDDVGVTVARLMREAGPEGRLAVLPDGPQMVPFVAEPTPIR